MQVIVWQLIDWRKYFLNGRVGYVLGYFALYYVLWCLPKTLLMLEKLQNQFFSTRSAQISIFFHNIIFISSNAANMHPDCKPSLLHTLFECTFLRLEFELLDLLICTEKR